jgi:hypothetical protein
MSVQVGLVVGISVLVAILGTASAAAGLTVFQAAWWVAAGIVLAAAAPAILVTPRRSPLSLAGRKMTRPVRVREEHT